MLVHQLQVIGETDDTGTTIRFKADTEIFKKQQYMNLIF